MLEIQKFLRNGGTVQELQTTRGIYSYEHPTLPLIGLKYDQIESPRADPIVIEARGIVLEKGTWNLVAKAFNRFFNLGEQPELFKDFDWTNFVCQTKEDGSLILLYHYAGEWRVNTSGSFAQGECNFSGKTWEQLFWDTAKIDKSKLEPMYTYVFELCTPYNKVVRTYAQSKVFLLSIFAIFPNEAKELMPSTVDKQAEQLGVERPVVYPFKSADEIMAFLKGKEETDKTFEGVVIRDKNNNRAKVKSATYVAIHHLMDNGNIFNPARQVPLILSGETDEVFAVVLKDASPELLARIKQTEAEVNAEWEKLKATWEQFHQIEDQKTFALTIKDKTPFTGILFSVRKQHGKNQTLDHLKKVWRDSADLITKRLYG
jgi:hypothetical protein